MLSIDNRTLQQKDYDARRDIAQRLTMLLDQLNGSAGGFSYPPDLVKAHTLAVLDRCKYIAKDMAEADARAGKDE